MMKKSILAVSFVGTLLIILALFVFGTHACYVNSYCKAVRSIINQDSLTVIYIFPVIFLLLLATYKMREEVFQAWWKLARWFVPVIMVITYLLNSVHQQSGFGGVAQGAFSFAFIFLLYVIFIITALIRIILAHRRLS